MVSYTINQRSTLPPQPQPCMGVGMKAVRVHINRHAYAGIDPTEYYPEEDRMIQNIDKILAFENGEMDDEQLIEFFQEMIDTGVVWQLQGVYGRTASMLINEGICHVQPTNSH